MSDNENAVDQQINQHDLLWRSECINYLNSVQSLLALEMSVSDSNSYKRLKPLLEEVISLRYKFMSFYLDCEL